jgi:hypothetical protein
MLKLSKSAKMYQEEMDLKDMLFISSKDLKLDTITMFLEQLLIINTKKMKIRFSLLDLMILFQKDKQRLLLKSQQNQNHKI